MKQNLTRRGFIGGAAAASAVGLLPSNSIGETKPEHGQKSVADTENRVLVSAEVAKVKWKAEPFAMTDVRLLPGFWKDMMELNRSWLYRFPTSASRTTSG